MPLFTWNPVPTFLAAKIDTQADLDAWLADLTPNEVGPKDDYTVVDLTGSVNEEEDQFSLEFILVSQVDGPQGVRSSWPLGHYLIADRQNIRPFWAEDEENFQRRFQPFNGLA